MWLYSNKTLSTKTDSGPVLANGCSLPTSLLETVIEPVHNKYIPGGDECYGEKLNRVRRQRPTVVCNYFPKEVSEKASPGRKYEAEKLEGD